MSVLITGVTGCLGSSVLDQLSKSTFEVIIGFDSDTDCHKVVLDNISLHFNDENFVFYNRSHESISKEFLEDNEIEEVYYLSCSGVNGDPCNLKDDISSFIHVYSESLKSSSVKKFLFGSTYEVYGHAPDYPCKEEYSSVFDSIEFSQRWLRALTSLTIENYISNSVPGNMKVYVVRFSDIYGDRDDPHHLLPYIINSITRNEPMLLPDRDVMRSFIHRRDAAKACVRLMSSGGTYRTYNCCSNDEISIENLVSKVSTIYEVISGHPYVESVMYDSSTLRGIQTRSFLDTDRLRQDIGFDTYVSLNQGIMEILKDILK